MTQPFVAVESFFDPVQATKIWPKSIAAQTAQRKELIERLSDVIDRLPKPDMALETAINQGHVTKEQVAKLYTALSELLESDQDYKRLVLYLPFEFLPKAPERFRQAYLKTWKRSLSIHDVRANFVDGDIIEEEQQAGNLPRVVKAAHLIPKLIENGFMEVKDILTLMEESDDQLLKESIADTLPVLADLGFLAEKEIRPRVKQIQPEPKFITEKRKAWLEWKKQKAVQPHQLSIIGDRHLAGPFSKNLELMEEMRDIEKMVASVESNPELSKFIYPVAAIFGSRFNGYGEKNADIDIAIFVRPGTSFSNRARLQKLLKETFAHEKIKNDEIIEFWLIKKGDRLQVCDFAEWDVSLGERYWTHILFGGAWVGSDDAMRGLREKLLIPYMYDDGEARRLYLEDLEQSTLQYRLMHKGYERFFPPYGGIHTKHSDEIDGKSIFWDSGFRQLATRLFISRVFLPKIPVNQK